MRRFATIPRENVMLPGLRLVIAAVAGTVLLVVLALAQLVKLQEAQSRAANLPPAEARFAGLAFAERADWTPEMTTGRMSLERLPPFDKAPNTLAAAEHATEPEPVDALAVIPDATPSSDSKTGPAALAEADSMALTRDAEPPEDASQVAVAETDHPDPILTVAKPEVAMLEAAPADDPLATIVLAIDPAPVDLTPSPPPADSMAALGESSATQAAAPPLLELPATAAAMPESEPPPAATSVVQPDPAKLEPAASASQVPDVKLPTPRPRRVKLAIAREPAAAHRAKPAKTAHPKTTSRRAQTSRPIRPSKPVRVVTRRPVTPPVAAQPVRPQPTDPFTALFGSPGAVTGARH